MERETTIQVNESDTLVLASAKNICELPDVKRRQVLDSWFKAMAATGTIRDVEGKANAKIRRHKSENFLKVFKAAIGADFFAKIFYRLAALTNTSSDLFLGFQCRWSTSETAINDSLGPMAGVKRLIHFNNSKEHLKGGITLTDTIQKCAHIVEETFGQDEKVFKHEDGEHRTKSG